MNPEALPAFAVCGWSESGKTTLLRQLVQRLGQQGLSVAVIKHDVHGMNGWDKQKDAESLFATGADVCLLAPSGGLSYQRGLKADVLARLIEELDSIHDAVLVEGFKKERFARKIWLRRQPGEAPPQEAHPLDLILDPGPERLEAAEHLLQQWVWEKLRARLVYAGVLVGGESRRMGQPKHLLRIQGKTWLEHIVEAVSPVVQQVVLLGAGEIPAALSTLPRLPDVPGRRGPVAGLLAAMRWQPQATWLFLACDLPYLHRAALDWLLAQRRPGCWAVLPRRPGSDRVEPLLAIYEPQIRRALEALPGPSYLRELPHVITPEVPQELVDCWRDVDRPVDLI